MSRCAALAVIFLFATPTAQAQFDINGPNAVLEIQGEVPSVADSVDHDIQIPVPGLFELTVKTNANPGVPLALALSSSPLVGNTLVVPWGGNIDIGVNASPFPLNVSVIGDGIFQSAGPLDPFFFSDLGNQLLSIPPTYTLNLVAGAQLDGARFSFQSVVVDPTNAPFFLDNTEAGDANFILAQVMVINPSATTPSQVSFLPGKTFNFHGVAYTDVFINANGFINFNNISGVPSNGFSIDSAAWMTAEPSISSWMADWDNTSAPDGILYEEAGNQLRIAWGDAVAHPSGLNHYFGSDSNNFELLLELQDSSLTNPFDGEFTINIITTDPSTTSQNGDGLIGHTPGFGSPTLLGGAGDVDLHVSRLAGTGVAQAEEHNATGGNASMLGYDGLGSPRAYNNVHSWNGTSIKFTPQNWAVLPGDNGYQSTPSMRAPDDVMPTVPSALALAGGQTITIAGKFDGFNDANGIGGTVVFDPLGAAMPGTVIGILDGTGALQPSLPNAPATSPFRDGEGLVIVTPTFPVSGTITLEVTFDNGLVFNTTVNVAPPGQILTFYNNIHSLSRPTQQHTLTVPVSFYSQTYNDFHICTHGYITFGSGLSQFQESIPEFFAGMQPSPTPVGGARPAVAAMWSDLNNPSTVNPNIAWEVLEDQTLGAVKVDFKNQNHWVTGNPAGNVAVVFGSQGTGSVTFDHTGFIPDPGATNTHGFIFGITDGDDQIGTDTNFSNGLGTGLFGMLGVYISGAANDSFAELIPQGANPMLGVWHAVDLGLGLWTLF